MAGRLHENRSRRCSEQERAHAEAPPPHRVWQPQTRDQANGKRCVCRRMPACARSTLKSRACGGKPPSARRERVWKPEAYGVSAKLGWTGGELRWLESYDSGTDSWAAWFSERRYYCVVKGSNLPNPVSLREYPDAEFSMGRKSLAVGSYDAAKFVGHVRDRNIGRHKSDRHI